MKRTAWINVTLWSYLNIYTCLLYMCLNKNHWSKIMNGEIIWRHKNKVYLVPFRKGIWYVVQIPCGYGNHRHKIWEPGIGAMYCNSCLHLQVLTLEKSIWWYFEFHSKHVFCYCLEKKGFSSISVYSHRGSYTYRKTTTKPNFLYVNNGS